MNTGFYKDLDTNFEKALELSSSDFSHQELIEMLRSGNIPQKQIAALKLEKINSSNEAEILISNLTGCDGKIREAVALKINTLLKQQKEYSELFIYPEIFADASIDINANICRLTIDTVSSLIEKDEFRNVYSDKILSFINEAFDGLDKVIFRDKKYVINKLLFKLYWSLEALKTFTQNLDKATLLSILSRTAEEKEYTIREKTAQIVAIMQDKDFEALKNRLKNDENYYVREVFK